MSHIVLTDEQTRVLRSAAGPVEVRDPDDQALGVIPAPSEEEIIVRIRRTRAAGPRYPAEDVHARLVRLGEIAEREPVDTNKARKLLRRILAGEEV